MSTLRLRCRCGAEIEAEEDVYTSGRCEQNPIFADWRKEHAGCMAPAPHATCATEVQHFGTDLYADLKPLREYAEKYYGPNKVVEGDYFAKLLNILGEVRSEAWRRGYDRGIVSGKLASISIPMQGGGA